MENKIWTSCTLLLTLLGFSEAVVFQTTPINTAGEVGSTPTLYCERHTSSAPKLAWNQYATSPIGAAISLSWLLADDVYSINYTPPTNPSRVDLSIPALQHNLTGQYECKIGADVANAWVLAVSSPLPCTAPSAVVAGQNFNVSCSVGYSGHWAPEAACTHSPASIQLNSNDSYTDNVALDVDYGYTALPGIPSGTVDCNLWYSGPPDNQTDFAENTPSYTSSWSTTINILYPPMTLTLTPGISTTYIGGTLTCAANANPPAQFLWYEVLANSSLVPLNSTEATLYVDTTLLGTKTLRCVAYNVINGDTLNDTIDLATTIIPVPPPTTTGAPTTSAAATMPTTTPRGVISPPTTSPASSNTTTTSTTTASPSGSTASPAEALPTWALAIIALLALLILILIIIAIILCCKHNNAKNKVDEDTEEGRRRARRQRRERHGSEGSHLSDDTVERMRSRHTTTTPHSPPPSYDQTQADTLYHLPNGTPQFMNFHWAKGSLDYLTNKDLERAKVALHTEPTDDLFTNTKSNDPPATSSGVCNGKKPPAGRKK